MDIKKTCAKFAYKCDPSKICCHDIEEYLFNTQIYPFDFYLHYK